MAAEITYAELRFKAESKPSGPDPDSPAVPKEKTSPQRSNLYFPKILLVPLLLFILLSIVFTVAFIIFFQKYTQLLEEETIVKEGTQKHTELECKRSNSTKKDKVWSCCPKNWESFSSHCYFYSTKSKSWQESNERCSSMEAHLVVITSEEEQHFITQYMKTNTAYYVGLSDPHGQRHWQWVDQTPYNESATFWHLNEPNNRNEHCVILNHRGKWGWNDVLCDRPQGSVCEMMNIYLMDAS
ncbi:C-type lectin domain family 4 member A [Heterocephalus glaber]|uniref:C-type lectin domain family 4 member A n=1 Tax=Heterocephalus glaber TaxID=10181 RepID=G5CAT6_HETGA|nr:C-type lectin domain family 4 member A [Heterocephalus glaber]EHB18647.1 C-type lectin domain family 4 member A [Heterocephalus glaber]